MVRILAVFGLLIGLVASAVPVSADTVYFSTWAGTGSPAQYTDETIWVSLSWDDAGYQPIANIPVHTVWNYRTTTSYLDWHTGGDGKAAMIRNISDATCGFTVRVDVFVDYDQHQIDSAYFTPSCGGYSAPPVSPSTEIVFSSVQGAPPGGTARVQVGVYPGGQTCGIDYYTPAGTHSAAQGLYPQTASGNGITWSWYIGTNTRSGAGSVTVTCGGVSRSATIYIG